MSDDIDQRGDAWSRYWASGRTHSCVGSFGDSYGGAIGEFWRQRFLALREGDRVLDLGTGNGPLPALLWEMRGPEVSIDAVDLARVAPAWYAPSEHTSVSFHSRVRMEALPFADQAFDAVVSQFGAEYAEREGMLGEVVRVSQPGATIALVMHHAGSVLLHVGHEELRHHGRLAGADGLFAAARRVVPWIARLRSGEDVGGNAAATLAREGYNRAMQDLAAAIEASPAPDLLVEARDSVHALVAGTGMTDAGEALERIDAYAAALEGARLRTAELVAHALDRDALEAMAAGLRRLRPGLGVELSELRQAEGILAWVLLAAPDPEGRQA